MVDPGLEHRRQHEVVQRRRDQYKVGGIQFGDQLFRQPQTLMFGRTAQFIRHQAGADKRRIGVGQRFGAEVAFNQPHAGVAGQQSCHARLTGLTAVRNIAARADQDMQQVFHAPAPSTGALKRSAELSRPLRK
jgi:hypothetical protein